MIRRFTWSKNDMDTLAVAVAKRLGHPVEPGGVRARRRRTSTTAGPKGTIPTYSFSALVNGQIDPRELRGKIVVVGATAPALQDLHATSAGNELMSGPEIQANAIWTLMHGLPLRTAPEWLNLLAIFALALIVPLLALRIRGDPRGARGARARARLRRARAVRVRARHVLAGRGAARRRLLLAAVATVAVSHLLETIRRQHVGRAQPACSRRRSASARASCAPPSSRSSSGSARPSSRATRRPATTSAG